MRKSQNKVMEQLRRDKLFDVKSVVCIILTALGITFILIAIRMPVYETHYREVSEVVFEWNADGTIDSTHRMMGDCYDEYIKKECGGKELKQCSLKISEDHPAGTAYIVYSSTAMNIAPQICRLYNKKTHQYYDPIDYNSYFSMGDLVFEPEEVPAGSEWIFVTPYAKSTGSYLLYDIDKETYDSAYAEFKRE